MATSRLLFANISTKHYHFEDVIARRILPEFQERVIPKQLITFLPADLLTQSDEERVAETQESRGREEAARLLLALMATRNDWVPRLQEGLRHREIRLEDMADKIDHFLREIPMEVDHSDDSDLHGMEVDAEPLSPVTDLSPGLQALLDGRQPRDLGHNARAQYVQLVMAEIAHSFFSDIARSPEDVENLTSCYERISSVMTKSFAIGCLELRLRIANSRGLRQIRRLAEGDILRLVIERALLSDERREWLVKRAASYGLKWRNMKVTVKIAEEELDRCETFLRSMEGAPNPRTPAESLLYKRASDEKPNDPHVFLSVHRLPKLLLSFLDWLLLEHPKLAEEVAFTYVVNISNLKTLILEAMALCRKSFGLTRDLENECAAVVVAMMDFKLTELVKEGPSDGTEEARSSTLALQAMPKKMFMRADPGSAVFKVVERLQQVKLLVPREHAGEGGAFCFSSQFVEDFAVTCFDPATLTITARLPTWRLSILHVLDLALYSNMGSDKTGLSTGVRSEEIFQRNPLDPEKSMDLLLSHITKLTTNADREEVMEMLYSCEGLIEPKQLVDLTVLPTTSFEPEKKRFFSCALPSNQNIRLCELSIDDMQAVSKTAKEVLSSRHSIDLTGKLTAMNEKQLKVILACAQISNLGSFTLDRSDGDVVLARVQTFPSLGLPISVDNSQHQRLKLCHNILTDIHIKCLLDALPGLESVSHVDLSDCTLSRVNLQRLLDNLNMRWVRGLSLRKVQFNDKEGLVVPNFCHLRRLQSVDLAHLGLQDSHMHQLSRQLCALLDLRELSLEGNPITTAGLSLLTPCLAACKTLRALRLAHCQLDAGAAFILGSLLTSAKTLHVLHLRDCRLMDSGLQHLSLVLKEHRFLSKVSLRNGGYSPHGLGFFLTHLAKCSRMQHLEIGHCPLEKDEVEVTDKLVQALAGSCQWDFLGLWKCRVGYTPFLQLLPTALPTQLRGLTELVLQDNDLKDEHVGHLSEAVKAGVFHSLSRLNLVHNHIGDPGAKSLAQVLHLLPRLSELKLQYTAITYDASLALCHASLPLPNMTLLDLSDSCNMTVYNIASLAVDLERIVLEGNIAVGEGVHFIDRDQILEQEFADRKMRALGFQDIPLTSELPSPSRSEPELAPIRYRRHAARQENDVTIDDHFLIKLGNNFRQ